MIKSLHGIYPAIVTPFDDNEINIEVLRELTRYVVDRGVNGVVACGTTGESIYLSFEEWCKVLETVTDEISNHSKVIAGIIEAGYDTLKDKILYARDLGVDALLIASSYYFKLSEKELYYFYSKIADECELPIILYNIPQCTGMYIDRKIVEDLCERSNIIGIKDSSGNLPYLNELINHVGNRISILCGYDEMVYPALMIGADGAILGTANLIPEIWVELYKNVRKKRFSMAMELHHKISRLLRLIRSNGGLIAIKACLEEIGLNVGLSRLPLKIGGSLSLESYEEILLELKRLGIIEDKVARHREIGRNELILRLEELGVPLKQGDISVGYGSKGKGINNVSIALVVGTIGGVLGYKWAEIYSLLKSGYEAVVAVHEPGLMTRPPTLIIPYYKIRNLRQASIIHGVVQSAVADAVTSYTIASLDKAESDKYIILALVAVDPNAIDRDEIYSNTLDAMNMAINMVFGRGG